MDSKNLKNQITSGVLWKFFERFSAQAVAFVVSMILARLLQPDDYAIVAIVNVFISIAEVFISGGLNSALIQNKDSDNKQFSTIFYCNCVLSVFLYGLLFIMAPLLADFYEIPSLTTVLRVFGLRLFPSAIQAIQVAYVSKHMQFKKFFVSTLLGTVISACVGIAMAIADFGVWALVAQTMVAVIVNTVVLYITVDWRPILYFHFREASTMIKFGWNVMWSNFIGNIFNQLNSLIIGKRYTTSDLAYYDKGKNLPRLLTDNISVAVSSVLFPAMSNTADISAVRQITQKSTRVMTYIIFPLLMGLAVVAEPLITVLLTEKWLGAVPYIQLVCLEGMIGAMDSVNGIQVLKALGKGKLIVRMEYIKKPIFLAITFLAMQFGVFWLAATIPLNAFFAMLINSGVAARETGYSLWRMFKDAFPAFWMGAVMCALVLLAGSFIEVAILKLAIEVIVGVIVYVALSFISRNTEFSMLLSTIRLFLKRKEA